MGSSAQNVAIAVAVVSWAQFTKIVRAKVQSLKGLSYIEAAKICGEKDLSIISALYLAKFGIDNYHFGNTGAAVCDSVHDVHGILGFGRAAAFAGLGYDPV